MPTRSDLLARTFVDVADTLVADFDIVDFLTVLTRRCVDLFDLGRRCPARGRRRPRARGRGVERPGAAARAARASVRRRPCLDCYHVGQPISCDDMAAEARWTEFVREARSAGYASVYAVPMRLRQQVIGSLNLLGSRVSTTSTRPPSWRPRRWPTSPPSASCSTARRLGAASARGATAVRAPEPRPGRAGQGRSVGVRARRYGRRARRAGASTRAGRNERLVERRDCVGRTPAAGVGHHRRHLNDRSRSGTTAPGVDCAPMTTPDARTGFSIADSVPGDYSLPHPGADAPNVVVIVLDDLGFAQLGCFGSDIATPTIDGLAAGGLRYNRFHVTACARRPGRACSPAATTTRSAWGSSPTCRWRSPATPAASRSRRRRSRACCATRATTRSPSASGTSCPRGERRHAGPFDRWPLGFGFERYYGFLQGDTNQWTPEPRARQPLRRPAARAGRRLPPHRGPRRRGDPARRSTSSRRRPTSRSSCTSRPARCTRRTTSRPSGSSRTAGAFDGGWERWRDRRVRPPGRRRASCPRAPMLAERPSWVAGVGRRSRADERRMLRASAGGVRRVPHAHRRADRPGPRRSSTQLGVLDNTLVMLISDNGASGEGGALGTFNEHRFTAARARRPSRATSRGSTSSAASAPTTTTRGAGRGPATRRCGCGSATRGSAARARRSIVHWPARHRRRRGEVREQFVHAIDLMPTVLDACGVDAARRRRRRRAAAGRRREHPRHVRRRRRARARARRSTSRCSGRARSSTTAGRRRPTTCRRAWSTRSACSRAAATSTTDRWALFHLDDDFAEAHDVAAEHPDVLTRPPGALDGGGRAQPGVPARRRADRRASPRCCRGPMRLPDAGRLPARGWSGARRLGGAALRRLPHDRRRRRPGERRGRACSAAMGDWTGGLRAVRPRRATGVRAQPRR